MQHSVTFVITSLRRGGAEGQLVKLATGLDRLGWSIEILTILPVNDYVADVAHTGIQVHVPDAQASAAKLLYWMVRRLRETRPRVVVTFLYHADILGRLAAQVAGVKHIVSSYRSERFGSRMREWVMRFTNGIPSAFVANYQSATSSLIERKLARADKLTIIPNGIDFNVGDRTAAQHDVDYRSKLNLPDKEFLWMAVGRLEAAKNYYNLLDAVSQLGGLDFSVIICGAGSLRDSLLYYRSVLGLSDASVRFLGQRSDIYSLLQIADGYVLSSDWEGMPNSLMEAMSMKLPVVATRVGGVPDLVVDGVSGFLVEPRDSERLADAMHRVMSFTKIKRQIMGQEGERRLKIEFGTEKYVERWESLLLGLENSR